MRGVKERGSGRVTGDDGYERLMRNESPRKKKTESTELPRETLSSLLERETRPGRAMKMTERVY